MALTVIRSSPALDSFTPLAEYQSQTPASFVVSKPVLHYHGVGATALAQQDYVSKLPIFATPEATQDAEDTAANAVASVDVFVTSENLILFNPSTSTGISISYPAISLHAIQRLQFPAGADGEVQGLYMQIELDPSPSDEDDEPETLELTIIPPSIPETESANPAQAAAPDTIKALFEAVSNCANLHPDPIEQDDEDMLDGSYDDRIVFEGEAIDGLPGAFSSRADAGGLPPPFPGSGGWITAENVNEFFDAEGNWIGGAEEEEVKRQRTE